MTQRYSKHYTVEEANALLPLIRAWLPRLRHQAERVEVHGRRLDQLLAEGRDLGGEPVLAWLTLVSAFLEISSEFSRRDIQVTDLNRGLIDFPALRGGREVFLCWEADDAGIEFWHELDSGPSGWERL